MASRVCTSCDKVLDFWISQNVISLYSLRDVAITLTTKPPFVRSMKKNLVVIWHYVQLRHILPDDCTVLLKMVHCDSASFSTVSKGKQASALLKFSTVQGY